MPTDELPDPRQAAAQGTTPGSAVERLRRACNSVRWRPGREGTWTCHVWATFTGVDLDVAGRGRTQELAALNAIETLERGGFRVG